MWNSDDNDNNQQGSLMFRLSGYDRKNVKSLNTKSSVRRSGCDKNVHQCNMDNKVKI